MSKRIDLQAEIENEIQNGAVAAEGNKFGVQVRNMELGDPLTIGDVITIPQNYKVLKRPITDGGDPVPYIRVTVTNKETGAERGMNFYPNQLAKVAFPLDAATGKHLPKVKTSGTAAAEYAKYRDADEAFTALTRNGDCKIEVTGDQEFTVKRFQAEGTQQTHIYKYDLM